ncbi:ImmA/IrrE family metallo-endopeptidase [Foetidibacter luteolus]|uniref:ImmA/IrrE family metallo-endopeptidase n=1 Tax=Foetidibacter luteolus TaxID=2608880 RepID=UPI00129ADB0D|nr:ImmA/IrrE family metallo-endopeptidase [Foetidibacter luteolus]
MSELVIEKAALSFRTNYGFNNQEPIRLKSLLQRLNVITSFAELSADFSGMAIRSGNSNSVSRFMLVNASQSIGKQHFTICHELYHLFVQEHFSSRICKTAIFDKTDKEEYHADLFASYLLLPKEGLLTLIPTEELSNKNKLTVATILYIEHYYSCSRRALLYRLKKLGLISTEQYDLFSVNVKRTALENGYNTTLYEPGNFNEIIGDYGSRAKGLYDSGKISESHYYTLLADIGVNIRDIEHTSDGE